MDTTNPTNRKFKRMFANILSVFVILAMAFPVTTVAYAAPSSPFLGQWQATDVDGSDIRLAIAGPPNGPFKITWTESYFGSCAREAGIIRGTGWLSQEDPNILEADLHLRCFTTGGTFDFHWAWHYDPLTGWLTSQDENYGGFIQTWHRAGQPSPWSWFQIIAHPDEDWVEGMGFDDGTVVSLRIFDPDGALLYGEAVVATYPEWEPGVVHAIFNVGYDLKTGDHLWMSDGKSAKELIVTNLEITGINLLTDTVSGIAEPSSEVIIEYPPDLYFMVTADENGSWTANVNGLTNNVAGLASQEDQDGDLTRVVFYSNPTFVAYLPYAIEGYDWPIGDEIKIFINDVEFPVTALSEQRPGFPEGSTRVLFDVGGGGISLQAGDHIMMTDEATGITKEVWVTNLAATDFDLNAGKVFGTYDPAYDLWVWLYDLVGQVPETDPDIGTWVATFTELPPGAWGGATQWDIDGDGTSVDFQVPNTRVVIANQPDWVNSGITVNTGQSFTIEAFGLMNPCSDTYPNGADYCIFYPPLGAEGVVPYENEFGIFPGPGLRFVALLVRIGDGEPFYVGAGGTFTAEKAGTLWFTPNDNLRTDNQGAYSVLVWLGP